MAQTVSQPRPAAIAAVLARSSQWTSARRKSDGKPFFFVPGSADAVYMTAVDGCTCPAAQNSRTGDCKHQAAVRQHTVVRQPAPKPRRSYEDLFPACAGGCGDLVERKGERCYSCGSDRERVQRQESKRRALVAS